ncbi:diguanylate cyclase (GGDEF)-like protein [Pseudomonas alcaligenes]|nr:diguanylate cyclase (GGDEF)-like protein [Pseudomonas alcaligenes]
MLLNDPVTLLLIITPFGLMTMLLLCLSYVGLGKGNSSLHWWIAGDLLLAAYRLVALMQPDIAAGALSWLGLFPPAVAFVAGTALLLMAIGSHTLALYHLMERSDSRGWHLKIGFGPALLYGVVAVIALHGSYIIPWFSLAISLTIALQLNITLQLRKRYRGAWGLLAGQSALILFHGWTLIVLTLHPIPPLPFDRPDLPSINALYMDFMVSFLFTLSYALMLQEQLRQHVQQLSITDTLTGALNRRGAAPILDREWAQAAEQRSPMAVAMIDLDHFKAINDQYGHAAGDAALQAFSDTVNRLKRQSDIFVRWGGEEFLLLFPHTDIQQAQNFMARLRDTLRRDPVSPTLPLHIGFSAGLADSGTIGSAPQFEVLLKAVDKALYRAKRQRDRVERVETVDL